MEDLVAVKAGELLQKTPSRPSVAPNIEGLKQLIVRTSKFICCISIALCNVGSIQKRIMYFLVVKRVFPEQFFFFFFGSCFGNY